MSFNIEDINAEYDLHTSPNNTDSNSKIAVPEVIDKAFKKY